MSASVISRPLFSSLLQRISLMLALVEVV